MNQQAALRPSSAAVGAPSPGDRLSRLSSQARRLVIAAHVHREPVCCADLLPAGDGHLGGFGELARECADAGLVVADFTGDKPAVSVPAEVAAALRAHLIEQEGRESVVAAHRQAAAYWQWRAATQPDDRSAFHDQLEARHHFIEANELTSADILTEEACARLHALGAFDEAERLISDTLARLPKSSPRRAAWLFQLGKARHLQGDYRGAERCFQRAMAAFRQLADGDGMAKNLARCYAYLGAMAQARGDLAEARRCEQRSQAVARSPAPGEAQEVSDDAGLAAAREAPARVVGPAPVAAAKLVALPVGEEPGETPMGEPARAAERPDSATGQASRRRAYPRHASSMGARAQRQRMLAAATILAAVATAAVLTAPAAIRLVTAGDPGMRVAATTRQRAAAWIARWVAVTAYIGCDPVMCEALAAHHVPASQLVQFTAKTPDPLGCDVVAATAAVRSQFDSRLGTVYAPIVLASFGSGPGRIEVRVVASGSPRAYRAKLRADLLDRQAAGRALLGNQRIQATGPAARLLAAGRVDSRLLITFAALAAGHRLEILGFGGAGPGASPGLPMLSADITAGPPAAIASGRGNRSHAGAATARSLAAIVAYLDAQRTPMRAMSVREVRLRTGQLIVRVEFAAPSPLGLFSGAGPPVDIAPASGSASASVPAPASASAHRRGPPHAAPWSVAISPSG